MISPKPLQIFKLESKKDTPRAACRILCIRRRFGVVRIVLFTCFFTIALGNLTYAQQGGVGAIGNYNSEKRRGEKTAKPVSRQPTANKHPPTKIIPKASAVTPPKQKTHRVVANGHSVPQLKSGHSRNEPTKSNSIDFARLEAGESVSDNNSFEFVFIPINPAAGGKPILLGQFEVTNFQWKRVMKTLPIGMKQLSEQFKLNSNPVVNVSSSEVQSFIDKLNKRNSLLSYRLPTADEWIFAAKANTTYLYTSGDLLLANQANCKFPNSKAATMPVGSFEPNGWGLYDMNGNVWELTSTQWDSANLSQIQMGGSWIDPPTNCSSNTKSYNNSLKSGIVGFRLAATTRTENKPENKKSETKLEKPVAADSKNAVPIAKPIGHTDPVNLTNVVILVGKRALNADQIQKYNSELSNTLAVIDGLIKEQAASFKNSETPIGSGVSDDGQVQETPGDAIEQEHRYRDELSRAYFKAGYIRYNLGSYDESLVFLSKSIEVVPNENAFNLKGVIEHYRENYDQAILEFTEAIKLSPTVPDFYKNRAESYTMLKIYDKANEDFKTASLLKHH